MKKIKTLLGCVQLVTCMGIAVVAYSLIVIAEKFEDKFNG